MLSFLFDFFDFTFNILIYILIKAKRTSHLHAPVMLLTGHEGEVFTAKFSPDGNFIASAGFEQTICILTISVNHFL